jgi:hypothetical protein
MMWGVLTGSDTSVTSIILHRFKFFHVTELTIPYSWYTLWYFRYIRKIHDIGIL